MTRPGPGTRDTYRAFVPLQTRWMDNDAYGHMNNATYYSLIDTAISLWQMQSGLTLTGPDAFRGMVAESGCRYFHALGFPDVIAAGLRITRLGTRSVRTEVGLFSGTDDSASAEGFFVQVHVDTANRPAPLTQEMRAVFATIAQ